VKGKPLQQLSKRPPLFKRKEEAIESLCEHKVPISRAIWYLKLTAAVQAAQGAPNKQKKSRDDQVFSGECMHEIQQARSIGLENTRRSSTST
jgi:hypothetical protein